MQREASRERNNMQTAGVQQRRAKDGSGRGSLKKRKRKKPAALASEQAQETPVPEGPLTPPQNQGAGLTKDNDMRPAYWRRRNRQYIKTQLELDGMRFKPDQFSGKKEEVIFLRKKSN